MPLLCEPNDAVWAVAVAKRREYHVSQMDIQIISHIHTDLSENINYHPM